MSMRFCVGLLVLGLLSVPVIAQPGPPQDDGPRQGPRRGPERMLNHLKSALDVNDQEWITLRPKIVEVMALRRDLAPMGGPPGMMMGGGTGPGDGPPPRRDSEPRDNNNDGPYGNPPATQPSQGNHNTAADQLPAGRQDDHQPPPPGAGQPPRSEVRDRFDDLQDALDNKDIKPQELEQKIAAYRAARKQAMEKLKKSQDDLRQSLTPMQQAVLITAGLMD